MCVNSNEYIVYNNDFFIISSMFFNVHLQCLPYFAYYKPVCRYAQLETWHYLHNRTSKKAWKPFFFILARYFPICATVRRHSTNSSLFIILREIPSTEQRSGVNIKIWRWTIHYFETPISCPPPTEANCHQVRWPDQASRGNDVVRETTRGS